ncbi:MAG: 23S rRNA (guanosine(2251)-2'-O)-methyltransferase RlmB [Candidatus Babeliales bacterium]
MEKKTKQKGTDLIYGIHPIIELLKAKRRKLAILYTTKPTPKAWQQLEPLLPKGLQIQYVQRDVLHKLAGTTDHQGVVGYAAPFAFRKKLFDAEKQTFLLMLDGVQDPRNLGAILRSAYCTNVDGVILTQKGSAPLNAVALKASAGLAEYLEILQVPTAKAGIQMLDKANYALYLAVLEKGQDASSITYKKPSCLVIGGEGIGISKEIRSSGTLITLPQKTADISYNASVAAGILLFIIAKQYTKI